MKEGIEMILEMIGSWFCLIEIFVLLFSNDIVLMSSTKRIVPYCRAIVWMTSGHCTSAAERVKNHVGKPSGLIVARTSYMTLEIGRWPSDILQEICIIFMYHLLYDLVLNSLRAVRHIIGAYVINSQRRAPIYWRSVYRMHSARK